MARERDSYSAKCLGSIKQADDFSRSFGEVVQCPNNRAPFGVTSFREAYQKAQIRLCVRIAGNSPQWGAVFQSAVMQHCGFSSSSAPPTDAGILDHHGVNELPMLAHNVKLVEREQHIVPSLVWLE